MSLNKSIGSYGESLCSEYLTKNNYKIIKRNFFCNSGEIDIIGFDNDILCFFEVKTRFSKRYGYPSESVTYSKKKNIIKVAKYYIFINKLFNYNVRFDILEVNFSTSNKNFKINHIKDAFRL